MNVWWQPKSNMSKMAQLGMKVVFGPECENPPTCTPAQWANEADRYGLKVVMKEPILRPIPSNLAGVMISIDEPNDPKGGNPPINPAIVFQEYQALKAAYGLPVHCSFGGSTWLSANWDRQWEKDAAGLYISACDVIHFNFYAINRNVDRYRVTQSADLVRKIRKYFPEVSKPILVWCECSDQLLPEPAPGQGTNRGPTPNEMAATVGAVVAAGGEFGWFPTCLKVGWPKGFWPLEPDQEKMVATLNRLYGQKSIDGQAILDKLDLISRKLDRPLVPREA
jgi:hypothetical protein